jgi:hypothetical protein
VCHACHGADDLTAEAALERDHHHGDLFDFGCGEE